MLYLLKRVAGVSCCMWFALGANEFIVKRKHKRVSFSRVKEELSDVFAEQLRLSADLLQVIGSMQVAITLNEYKPDQKQLEPMPMLATHLRNYAIGLDNLLEEPIFIQLLYFTNTSLPELLAHITCIMGSMQQKVITYLQQLFEGDTKVFHKKHCKPLQATVIRVKNANRHLKELKKRCVLIQQSFQLKDPQKKPRGTSYKSVC